MGKFKDHVLFLAFVLLPLLFAFGLHARASGTVPVLCTVAFLWEFSIRTMIDCQPQSAVVPWIKTAEYKFKQGGQSKGKSG